MTDEQNSDAPENAAAATSAPARSKKGALLAGIAVVAGAVTGVFALGPMFAGSASATTTASADSAGDKHGDAAAGEHGAKVIREPRMLENLVLNPAGTRGTRFLLLTVGVQLSDQLSDDEFAKREVEVRDRVIELFGTKSIDELVDVSRRGEFRGEVSTALDALFGKGKVRGVFFPQFVVQ